MIRATFALAPPGWAGLLADLRPRLVRDDGTVVTVDIPDDNWGPDPALPVSAVLAGEVMEPGALTRCRVVGLELPEGWYPGPFMGAPPRDQVGVIVKPALGLSPVEVADVVRAAVAGGATFVKDDETLGDPSWCPMEERVAAVAKVLEPGVVYCPNVTGRRSPSSTGPAGPSTWGRPGCS